MKINFTFNNCNVTINQLKDNTINELTKNIELLQDIIKDIKSHNSNNIHIDVKSLKTPIDGNIITSAIKQDIKSSNVKPELIINTETCLCTDEEREQLFGTNNCLVGEDLVNFYIERLQLSKSKEEKDNIHKEALNKFYDSADDMEYYQYWLKELQIFLDDPAEEIQRLNNLETNFRNKCREDNIESAIAEVKGNRISEQKTQKEKDEMPDYLRQFMVNYDEEYMRKLDSQSEPCKEALNLIGQSVEIFELKSNLLKVKDLIALITDKEEINTIRNCAKIRQDKLIRQHDDEMFSKIFNSLKEDIEMSSSIKQKWFKWYEFEKKFKDIRWSSPEARSYAETDVHNYKEEKFPEWEQKK